MQYALSSHYLSFFPPRAGENVTECTGGPEKLLEHDLPLRYTTYCDPRLNYAQGESFGAHLSCIGRVACLSLPAG